MVTTTKSTKPKRPLTDDEKQRTRLPGEVESPRYEYDEDDPIQVVD